MCYPWRWHLEKYVDYFPLVQQFRALDRFAWVPYIVLSVTAAWMLDQILKELLLQKRKAVFAVLFGAPVLTLWTAEAFYNLKPEEDLYKGLSYAREYFNNDNYLSWISKAGYSPEQFQSIVALPFFHIGSEKFWLDYPVSMYEATRASYSTGLPTLECFLGRLSLSNTMKAIQLMSGDLMEKEIIHDLPNKKPFLLITNGQSLNDLEQKLVSQAQLITSNAERKIYSLPLSSFETNFSYWREFLSSHKDSLYNYNFFKSTQPVSVMRIRLFNKDSTDLFLESGIREPAGSFTLYDSIVSGFDDSIQLEISVWLKITTEKYTSPDLYERQYSRDGKLIEEKYITTAHDTRDVYQDWIRLSNKFSINEPGTRLQVFLKCESAMIINSFLIRPIDTHIFYNERKDGSFMLDNFFIPPLSQN